LRSGEIKTIPTGTTGFRYLLRLSQHGKKLTKKLRNTNRNTLMDTSGFAKNRKRSLRHNENAGRNCHGFGRVEGAIDAKFDLARGHTKTFDEFRQYITANEPPADGLANLLLSAARGMR